jgi:hypothetical protein
MDASAPGLLQPGIKRPLCRRFKSCPRNQLSRRKINEKARLWRAFSFASTPFGNGNTR